MKKKILVLVIGLLLAGIACQGSPTAIPTVPSPVVTVISSPSPRAVDSELTSPLPTLTLTSTAEPTRSQVWLPSIMNGSQATATTLPSPLPAATATPVPAPTPAWPDPLTEPGASKVGLHVVRNNSPWIMEFVRRVRPVVVKAVGDVGWLGEVKKVSPETVTIGRLMATHQDMNGDPIVAAQAFVAEQLTRYQLNPGIDYWEGWNEPDPNEQMGWYAAFEAERARLMAEHGFRVAVGGFAAGVPEWDEFLAFLPAIEAAQQYGGILSLHEYGAPTLDYLVGSSLPGWPGYSDRGVLALRYRWWYEEILIPRGLEVPLVISETGIDGILMPGERPGPGGFGWQDFVGYWEEIGVGNGVDGYLAQLAWYDSELRRDDYVIGCTVFTAGGGDRWSSYEINGILPQLAQYLAQAH